ncbi:MAG: hypothetical protein M3R17_11205 [Bacteroidota bacterium]|nr:hypothetical protein [Bacteroidota bacterium]
MKKILAYSFAFLFSVSLAAQEKVGDTPTAEETHNYFAGSFNYYFLPMASVKARYTALGVDMPDGTMMIGVGLDRGYNTITNKLDNGITGLLSFHYLLPQHFSNANDSIKVSFNGYNAQFDLLGINFVKSEIITVTGGLGWSFGRVKVMEEIGGAKTTFLNKYFAPQGRFEFNVRFLEHFYIGVRYAYRADITKTRWTRTGVNSQDLQGVNMSGTMIGAFIGYGK